MVSWGRFWHGYWTSYRLPENDIFTRMAVPSGWKREFAFRFLGLTIWFVYPVDLNAIFRRADGIL